MRLTTGIIIVLFLGTQMMSCSSGSKNKKTEEELYTMAQEFSEKGDFQSAIETYQEILKTYPDSPWSYKAQFLIGFVYSENLKDHENAKMNYKKVIENYPNCDLADDAGYMLEQMEKGSIPIISDSTAVSSE